MRNYFRITGYAVNKRGLTVGIGYEITSSDTRTAKANAMLQAQREGLIHIRIIRVQEVEARLPLQGMAEIPPPSTVEKTSMEVRSAAAAIQSHLAMEVTA